MSTIIFQISLESLARSGTLSVLDITPVATAGRFRLIDCTQYIHDRTLSIREFPDFPIIECTYAAISYIWRGNSIDESTVGPRFSVAGAEDGDPIGMDVLVHACTAALREGVKCIWLDRLCIMQTSKEDKHWQIGQMFDIYKRCALCIVLPGGVQRLVRLDEHTTWINRGWTLQETLAPPRVEVIYSWKWGSGMYYRDRGVRGNIIQLIPGESAMTPLSNVFNLYGSEPMNFFPSADGSHTTFRTELFGPPYNPSSNVMLEQTTEIVIFMLKNALVKDTGSSEDGDFDDRAPAIWRSALFRTSKRPVDMVFSIMGLFGVTLDTRRFGKDDRLGATIALMQAILHRGGRASWLGAAPYLPVNPRLSTFPVFPRTNVQGQVLFEFDSQTINEQERRSHNRTILDARGLEMPMGSMDDAGYLLVSRKALRIYPLFNIEELRQSHWQDFDDLNPMAEPPRSCLNLSAINGTGWKFYKDSGDSDENSPRVFAVLLGWFNEFSHEGFWNGPRHIGTLLIKEHAPNRFHVESFFELSDKLEFWVERWQEHTLHIGGPESDSRQRSAGIR
ncbi:hypothetical protein EV421DRAFT_424188 [Armillaria borealis]|uniref:Heterokaryon incompatibility domain-containing protein n=1 Tax=Armillaria borealis TaxID=47425 RepID=A0AA39K572_9AGAR|nr:hypothetical protein EV421DRAFT_424188 [Armillaria borealis]